MSFLNTQQEFDTPGEALLHYGVKGMKWGVRKAYTTRVSAAAARDRKVGNKEGATLGEKIQTHGKTTYPELIRSGGSLTKAALNRADRDEAHVARINSGQGTSKDVLKMVGSVRFADIVRAQKRD